MDDDPFNADHEPEDRRAKGWDRFRAKFPFRRRRSSGESLEEFPAAGDVAVSDFLYSTGHSPDGRRLAPPKIDVSAAKRFDSQPEAFEKFRFTKPPRIVGLRVNFSNGLPEVIGIGGEDALEPAINVSRKKRQLEFLDGSQIVHPEHTQVGQRRALSDDYLPQSIQIPPITSNSAPQLPLSPSRLPGLGSSPDAALKGLRRRPYAPNPGDFRLQMRADEGRVFLAASPNSPKAVRRKPIGGSDSESSSRTHTPSPQQLSPPPSRGSDPGVSQPPQYPPALLPSRAKMPLTAHERTFSEASSLRPPSSGSESSSRTPPERMKQHSSPNNGPPIAYPDQDAPFVPPGPSGYSRRPAPPTSNPRQRNESPSQRLSTPTRASGSPKNNVSNRSAESPSRDDTICNEPLEDFRISVKEWRTNSSAAEVHSMPWRRTHVYQHKKDDEGQVSIKIVIFDTQSSLADISPCNRMFKLDKRQPHTVTLQNKPSPALGISINPKSTDPRGISQLQQVQSLLRSVETEQNYQFTSLQGAHAFQAAVTGYTVRFDGIAQFSISRRRTVISIHKSLEAADARIQIVQGKRSTRLVAFFSGYELAECLHFEVKSFDVIEAMENKDGMFCVKLVDAKFALPDPKRGERPTFVSLDSPELPSEHEDITIGFHDETVRDDFAAALPVEVTGPKKFTLKRRI